MASSDWNCKPHAILISVPFQGHINPFTNLALKLASTGITVTFVHLRFVHQMLTKSQNNNTGDLDIFFEARKAGLDIRYTTISDGLPLEYDRSVKPEEYWGVLFRDFPAFVDEFVGKTIMLDQSLVHFLVTDTFYAWPASIANKYKLVSVSFWTEPALVFSLIYHSKILKEHGHFPCKDDAEEDVQYLPGIDSINTRDFMPYIKESEIETVVSKSVMMAIDEVKKVDFILHNNVQELEPETFSALNKLQPNYAIGPVNFSKNIVRTAITNSLHSESDCTQWLASKSPGSVLYVSFGSVVQTNKQLIEEIANGILLSEINFIWVIRAGLVGSDDNVLPNGFEDKIKDRGLIVPWCNQIMVLSNPAVRGFLTHCGWNSISESIWCGVPMICYPVTYDQPTNRKLVVDDWKIGINLCDGTLVHRENVAESIRKFMDETIYDGLKQEMKKASAILHDATEIGGSSENNFDRFIGDLKAKINATTC